MVDATGQLDSAGHGRAAQRGAAQRAAAASALSRLPLSSTHLQINGKLGPDIDSEDPLFNISNGDLLYERSHNGELALRACPQAKDIIRFRNDCTKMLRV